MANDPVCGRPVDENVCTYKTDYKGTTYYFCSASCQLAFRMQPDTIVKRLEEKRVPGMGEASSRP